MSRKKKITTKYSPEFKLAVIMDKRENYLGCRETVRKYWQTTSRTEEDLYCGNVRNWERIYLEEGEVGLMTERRGRKSTGRPKKKLDKSVEEDLIAENQRLKEQLEYAQMEIEYLKKLDALVQAREQPSKKNRK